MHPSSPTVETRTVLNKRRHLSAGQRLVRSRWLDLWDLIKPEISFLVTISALAGFLLASPSSINPAVLMGALSGIAITAAGSGVLNHVLESRFDALMHRTARRPIPAGRISATGASILGLVLVLIGTVVLFTGVNVLTGWLALTTVGAYLLVYTPMKRRSRYNTLIGCIPGALPALGGWTAATGSVGVGGLALFAILFVWQMPHFLSLAWMYRKDYSRADFAMLPVLEPDGRSTGRQVVLFTIALFVASLLPVAAGLAGLPYLLGVIALGAYFLKPAVVFAKSLSHHSARAVLLASIVYVPALVLIIFVDRLV